MIDRMLVTVISGVVLISIGLQYILLCIPVLKKTEFNMICHNYAMRMESQSGLSTADLMELQLELEERGFYVVKRDAGRSYSFGQPMLLIVNALFVVRRLTPAMTSQNYTITMTFQYQQYSRG